MTGALARLIQRPPHPGPLRLDHCELCSIDIAEAHSHLWDAQHATLVCVCPACRLLFPAASGTGTFLPIPERRTRLPGIEPATLGIPVGLAYFTLAADGAVTAHYPSPAGATGWEVDPAAWTAAGLAEPALRTLHPVVEALLVTSVRGSAQQAWIVPVTDCHRLVALIRTHWTGFLGGSRVWDEVRDFFDRLTPTTPPPERSTSHV
jgi:hypothetical protein